MRALTESLEMRIVDATRDMLYLHHLNRDDVSRVLRRLVIDTVRDVRDAYKRVSPSAAQSNDHVARTVNDLKRWA